MRNADWNLDETVLLMDLYLDAPRAGKTHPEVIALSTLLRAAARRDGRTVSATFRNPAGIAMRLRNFGRYDPSAPEGRDAGLRPGGEVDRLAWQRFGSDRAAVANEAMRIRRSIAAADWTPAARSSRGPAPAFGRRTSTVPDGETSVYLLLLDGPVAALAPGVGTDPARSVCKLGRTSDLERRMAELASGLPPASAIRYLPIALKTFRSASAAHVFERRLLDLCDERGWSLGGEFAYAPLSELRAAIVGTEL